MTNPTLRPATDADGDGLATLIAGCFSEYEGCHFDRPREFPELDAIATHFAERGGAAWVLDRDGVIVGSIACAPCGPDGTFELFKLYVAQSERGRGCAQTLLAQVIAFARSRHAPALLLFTDTRFLDAHRFYERNGFLRLPGERALHDLSNSFEFPYRLDLIESA